MTNGENTATVCVLNLHFLRFPLSIDYPNLSVPIKSGISLAVTVERTSKREYLVLMWRTVSAAFTRPSPLSTFLYLSFIGTDSFFEFVSTALINISSVLCGAYLYFGFHGVSTIEQRNVSISGTLDNRPV